MRLLSLSTTALAALGLLASLGASTAFARDWYDTRYEQRCDSDGDRCATFRCDRDGEDCVRVSNWSSSYYKSHRYPSYYGGYPYSYDYQYYGRSGYTTRRRCDADGDNCVLLRCDGNGDNCRSVYSY